jgi:isopentenyl-diphosphate delta-isomerase
VRLEALVMAKDELIFTRKDQHLILSVKEEVESTASTMLEDVKFIHQTVLEHDFSEVDTSTVFFGHKVSAPLMISGMTGGTALSKKINSMLAELAEAYRIPIGVGSQRVGLKDPSAVDSYRVVRDKAPDAPRIANIGASQVSSGLSISEIEEAIEMIDADALAVHLNPLQEALQPEGEPSFRNFLVNLEKIVQSVSVPVILKQTGEGFSKESAQKLVKVGIRGIDVGGLGGTSFAVIEGLRARLMGLDVLEEIARDFTDWGIPTAASILEVRSVLPGILLIATGGIRTGIDAAKVVRLGADFAGVALPVLRRVYAGGTPAGRRYLEKVLRELKTVIFLVGGRTLEDLRKAPIIITGTLKEWMIQRGLTLRDYAS